MSKGRKIVPVRLSQEIIHEVNLAIERAKLHANSKSKLVDFTFGEWVRKAIQEKLDHLKR